MAGVQQPTGNPIVERVLGREPPVGGVGERVRAHVVRRVKMQVLVRLQDPVALGHEQDRVADVFEHIPRLDRRRRLVLERPRADVEIVHDIDAVLGGQVHVHPPRFGLAAAPQIQPHASSNCLRRGAHCSAAIRRAS